MSGNANNRVRAKQSPCSVCRHIVLAKMNTISFQRECDINAVIDYDFQTAFPPCA
jgi:hypothetical protein